MIETIFKNHVARSILHFHEQQAASNENEREAD